MEKEKAQVDIIGNGYKKPGAKPARVDNRKQKRERGLRRDFIREEW